MKTYLFIKFRDKNEFMFYSNDRKLRGKMITFGSRPSCIKEFKSIGWAQKIGEKFLSNNNVESIYLKHIHEGQTLNQNILSDKKLFY